MRRGRQESKREWQLREGRQEWRLKCFGGSFQRRLFVGKSRFKMDDSDEFPNPRNCTYGGVRPKWTKLRPKLDRFGPSSSNCRHNLT